MSRDLSEMSPLKVARGVVNLKHKTAVGDDDEQGEYIENKKADDGNDGVRKRTP